MKTVIGRPLLLVGCAILAISGCGSGVPTPSPAAVTQLAVGLGYIPSVQFAPLSFER